MPFCRLLHIWRLGDNTAVHPIVVVLIKFSVVNIIINTEQGLWGWQLRGVWLLVSIRNVVVFVFVVFISSSRARRWRIEQLASHLVSILLLHQIELDTVAYLVVVEGHDLVRVVCDPYVKNVVISFDFGTVGDKGNRRGKGGRGCFLFLSFLVMETVLME